MEIKLGGKRGGIALVSEEDYEWLSKYNWHMDKEGYIRSMINNKNTRMHRYIMNATENNVVDHINEIKYDNRRINLRVTTDLKNGQNRRMNKNKKSSSYKGVSYVTIEKKYKALLVINYKPIYLGLHEKEIDAAEAVDMYLVHTDDLDHIPMNFPEKKDEYLKRPFVPYKIKKPNKTIYRGVTKRKYGYTATITINKKSIHIGASPDLIICAKMWDQYIVDNDIPHRKLNFPEDHKDYNPQTVKTRCEIVDNKTVRLILDKYPDKKILIDKEDYDKVKCYPWSITPKGYVRGYVDGITVRLHRFLTNTTNPKIYVDHIDSNPLNNIRSNLRLSDSEKNSHNAKKQENTLSKYIGSRRTGKRWYSSITFNSVYKYIGCDETEIDAARRRDLYVLDNFPDEHYKLNFEWTEKDIKKWKKKLSIKPITEISANQILINAKNILTALSNNDMLLVTKLNSSLNEKMKIANEKYII